MCLNLEIFDMTGIRTRRFLIYLTFLFIAKISAWNNDESTAHLFNIPHKIV